MYCICDCVSVVLSPAVTWNRYTLKELHFMVDRNNNNRNRVRIYRHAAKGNRQSQYGAVTNDGCGSLQCQPENFPLCSWEEAGEFPARTQGTKDQPTTESREALDTTTACNNSSNSGSNESGLDPSIGHLCGDWNCSTVSPGHTHTHGVAQSHGGSAPPHCPKPHFASPSCASVKCMRAHLSQN